MQGRSNSIARARAIYDGRLHARGTKRMRGHLEAHAADSSALLATSVLCDYLNRWNDAGETEIAKAEAAVSHVLLVKPDHYLGHYAKGFLHRTRGEHEQALAEFTETIRHNPRFARAIAQRGNELIYVGRPQEGIAEVQRAIDMAPKSPSLGMFQWIIGRARFVMGEDREAIDWLQKSVKSWPDLWYNRACLIAAFALAGQTGAAKRRSERSTNASPAGRSIGSSAKSAPTRTTTPSWSTAGNASTTRCSTPACGRGKRRPTWPGLTRPFASTFAKIRA